MGLGVVGPPSGPQLDVRFKPAASLSATSVTPDFCTRTGAELTSVRKSQSPQNDQRHTAPTLLQSDDKPSLREATYWVGTTSLCVFLQQFGACQRPPPSTNCWLPCSSAGICCAAHRSTVRISTLAAIDTWSPGCVECVVSFHKTTSAWSYRT